MQIRDRSEEEEDARSSLLDSWEKSSLDRPALPPPPCVVAEARQKRSRGVASAARNGNTGDRSAALPVFVPVLRGFSHTRPRSFRSHTLARFLRRAYASDRLVRAGDSTDMPRRSQNSSQYLPRPLFIYLFGDISFEKYGCLQEFIEIESNSGKRIFGIA